MTTALPPVIVVAFLTGDGAAALMAPMGGDAKGSVPPPHAISAKEIRGIARNFTCA
jgi:hypothetical protein